MPHAPFHTAMTALGLSLALLTLPAAAQTVDAGNGWTCTADKILNARYDGKKRAYIHLAPYGKGERYRVTLNADKTQATGKTGNATPFVCTKS